MKTIDFLVQELPKLGGWPDGAVAASFLCSKNTLSFANENGGCPSAWRFIVNCDVEDRCIEVTREQYEAALAAKNDGWIEWGGGECPVPCGTMVDVKHRCGAVSENQQAWPKHRKKSDVMVNPLSNAGQAFWRHENSVMDIIAYRLHQSQEAELAEADDEIELNECIGQDAAPVWNGEGVTPPVGCVCESSWAGDEWQSCKILFASGQIVVVKLKESGMEDAYNIGDVAFRPTRPIRSAADRNRDEAVKTIMLTGWCQAFAEEIYDLIAAGKVPGIKLED